MGLLDYADAAGRKFFGLLSRAPDNAKQMALAAYQLATDQNARKAAMSRQPMAFSDEAAAKNQAMAEGFWNPTGLLGTFAGVNAKTANKLMLEAAQKMDKAGADRGAIWKETGWFKGPDSKWRFEIDDSAATHRPYQFTPAEAHKNAKTDAMIYGDEKLFERAKSMAPYATKTRNQLRDEYKTTGGMIVDAARSGNKDEAMKLVESRKGLDNILSEMGNRPYGPMSSYLKHGELGAAYPDVYKMHTRISKSDAGDFWGQYRPENPLTKTGEQILLSEQPRFSKSKSTALHELQHAIQHREGFARGGSPEAMSAFGSMGFALPLKIVDEAAAIQDFAKRNGIEIATLKQSAPKNLRSMSKEAWHVAETRTPELLSSERMYAMAKENPALAYLSLAGEAEARATQARMNMTPAERKAKAPWESYDIPWDQLIVRY